MMPSCLPPVTTLIRSPTHAFGYIFIHSAYLWDSSFAAVPPCRRPCTWSRRSSLWAFLQCPTRAGDRRSFPACTHTKRSHENNWHEKTPSKEPASQTCTWAIGGVRLCSISEMAKLSCNSVIRAHTISTNI